MSWRRLMPGSRPLLLTDNSDQSQKDISGVTYHFGGDEHGMLALAQPSREIKLGDKLEFLVPHCDPNVNLYDQVFCIREDRVEEVWPIVRGYR